MSFGPSVSSPEALGKVQMVNGILGGNVYPQETTVLVAVQSQRVREALAAMVNTLEGFRVIGEAADEQEALRIARMQRPSLAIVDEDLPGCCGAWTVETLTVEGLADSVVTIGLRADGGQRALAAGAQAYVQTGVSPEDLREALKQATFARQRLSKVTH